MFTLPDLPYDYSALEPFIDTETMHLHHDKHHAGYVKNLNDLLQNDPEMQKMDINSLLQNLDKVEQSIRQKVTNNAGGVANHNMFWEIMCPADQSPHPVNGSLLEAINKNFGSISDFQNQFSDKALSHFGSGWAWIVQDNSNKENSDESLKIITTSNQDSPITHNSEPILCLDVWEHAYYLKYKNVRADYIKAWWNVVNWKEVERRFLKTM